MTSFVPLSHIRTCQEPNLFPPLESKLSTIRRINGKCAQFTSVSVRLAYPVWKSSCSEAGRITKGFALCITCDRLSKFSHRTNVILGTYKKCSADEEANQRRALTTVPTIMRLSLLAFFIALPAAAYAAACSQQNSINVETDCAERGDYCNDDIPCCGRLQCNWNGYGSVCITVHLLIYVGY